MVLIDAAYVAVGGAGALETFVAELPSWVLPVVVVGRHGTSLLAQTRAALEKAYNPRRYEPEAVRRALMGVSSLREFTGLMPFLVSSAEREYVRHGPTRGFLRRASFRPPFVYPHVKAAPNV